MGVLQARHPRLNTNLPEMRFETEQQDRDAAVQRVWRMRRVGNHVLPAQSAVPRRRDQIMPPLIEMIWPEM
jgi:hypothetical protein